MRGVAPSEPFKISLGAFSIRPVSSGRVSRLALDYLCRVLPSVRKINLFSNVQSLTRILISGIACMLTHKGIVGKIPV